MNNTCDCGNAKYIVVMLAALVPIGIGISRWNSNKLKRGQEMEGLHFKSWDDVFLSRKLRADEAIQQKQAPTREPAE